jgi:hypothetical protein
MSSSEELERNEAFLENEVQVLKSRVKSLEYDCAGVAQLIEQLIRYKNQ